MVMGWEHEGSKSSNAVPDGTAILRRERILVSWGKVFGEDTLDIRIIGNSVIFKVYIFAVWI